MSLAEYGDKVAIVPAVFYRKLLHPLIMQLRRLIETLPRLRASPPPPTPQRTLFIARCKSHLSHSRRSIFFDKVDRRPSVIPPEQHPPFLPPFSMQSCRPRCCRFHYDLSFPRPPYLSFSCCCVVDSARCGLPSSISAFESCSGLHIRTSVVFHWAHCGSKSSTCAAAAATATIARHQDVPRAARRTGERTNCNHWRQNLDLLSSADSLTDAQYCTTQPTKR
jgi:hypothetical protein